MKKRQYYLNILAIFNVSYSASVPVNISEVCYSSAIACRSVSYAPNFTGFLLYIEEK